MNLIALVTWLENFEDRERRESPLIAGRLEFPDRRTLNSLTNAPEKVSRSMAARALHQEPPNTEQKSAGLSCRERDAQHFETSRVDAADVAVDNLNSTSSFREMMGPNGQLRGTLVSCSTSMWASGGAGSEAGPSASRSFRACRLSRRTSTNDRISRIKRPVLIIEATVSGSISISIVKL
jgi:hypothetical protein